MKKLFNALGTIAMLSALVLSFTACNDLMSLIGGDDKKTDTPNLGKTMTLSGQVYVMKMDEDSPLISFETYKKGDLIVTARGMTEKGIIQNGQLSITLGTPALLGNIKDDDYEDDALTVSPSNAKGYSLVFYIENTGGRQRLERGYITIVGTTSATQEMVQYFYVDRDVTISSKEKINTYDTYDGVTETYTDKAYSLSLKAGWNTLYIKASINESGKTKEYINTISLANPSNLKWVLSGSDEGGGASGGSDSDDDDDDGDGDMVWTAITNSSINYTTAIAYGNDKFVAWGWDGYTSKMAYSSDCVSWTAVNSIFGSEPVDAISYGNDKFVAGGHSGTIAWSSDAVTWTAVSDSTFGRSEITSISYGNSKFVAGGKFGKMAYSSDGITWTAVSDSPFGEDDSPEIAYGNNKFVAGGDDGKMAYSSDGINWTAVTNRTFVTKFIRAIAYGSNNFVAVGTVVDEMTNKYVGKMAYSSDGIIWTAVSDSTFGKSEITSIGYGNDKFIAGGEYGKMAYSSDGATWTSVNVSNIFGSTINDHIDSIAYGNGKFVAGGSNGKMAYSN